MSWPPLSDKPGQGDLDPRETIQKCQSSRARQLGWIPERKAFFLGQRVSIIVVQKRPIDRMTRPAVAAVNIITALTFQKSQVVGVAVRGGDAVATSGDNLPIMRPHRLLPDPVEKAAVRQVPALERQPDEEVIGAKVVGRAPVVGASLAAAFDLGGRVLGVDAGQNAGTTR